MFKRVRNTLTGTSGITHLNYRPTNLEMATIATLSIQNPSFTPTDLFRTAFEVMEAIQIQMEKKQTVLRENGEGQLEPFDPFLYKRDLSLGLAPKTIQIAVAPTASPRLQALLEFMTAHAGNPKLGMKDFCAASLDAYDKLVNDKMAGRDPKARDDTTGKIENFPLLLVEETPEPANPGPPPAPLAGAAP
jgi:hypothetical protein